MSDTNVYFHERSASRWQPAGITVSRSNILPSGDFRITEYAWGSQSLWFLDSDAFDADERQAAYLAWRAAQEAENDA